jgi:hypothetical protein
MKSLEFKRIARMSLAATGLLIGLALVGAAPVAAQDMSPEQACKDDAFRLCDEFIPDRDKVGACLRRKARSLSPACRTFVVGGGRQHYTGRGRTHVRVRTHHHTSHHPRHHK